MTCRGTIPLQSNAMFHVTLEPLSQSELPTTD
jgi:hypothetical protein